jgi:GNAT superfamily N-acetyltransferase
VSADLKEFPIPIQGGLELRAVQTDEEAEKVAVLNGQMHGLEEENIVRHWLFHGHPTMKRDDWLFVVDVTTGGVAATLCLMDTTWVYGGTSLAVAELGFVGTHPDYRRRGLQIILSDAFDKLALSRGYTLAAIEGIPGFYGQFGYEYAVPLLGGATLDYEQVPEMDQAEQGLLTRSATLQDAPGLAMLYDASIGGLDLAALRSIDLWRYQLAASKRFSFYPPVEVMEHDGQAVGYFRWTDDDWTDRLRIVELAVRGGQTARACILGALRFAREKGELAGKRCIALQLPENHPAVEYARYLGGADTGYYGWQMKVLDPVCFLRAIGPALEERLEASLQTGYTGALRFLLYGQKDRLDLRFQDGRLVDVSTTDGNEADARMTLKQATQLWLGWRGREALERWCPDFRTQESARQLIDVLFPKSRAYIYMPY